MRFLADVGISPRIVAWLRSEGHDVWDLRDHGLQRLPDAEIFQRAAAGQRVVLTFDLDFGEIVALTGGEKASVVVFRLRNTRVAHVQERLRTTLASTRPVLEQGAVVLVEESRHRIRRLPIGG